MATYLGNSDSQQTSSNNSFSCRPNDNNQESNRSNSNTDDTLYYSCESSTLFLRLLEDAIACMPHSEKEAYLMANDAVPELIQQESNPIDLICFEHFNIWDACQRLMNYWKWKQYLFQDRVYHSIYDLSGNGALDDMDLQRLSTGYGTLLPNDTNGNAVFLIDRTRLEQIGENYDETLDPIRNLRLAFYFAALAALEQKKLFPSSIMVTPANGATILSESSPLSSSSSSCCYYTSSCSRRSLVVLNLIRTLPTFKQPATLLTAVMRDTSAVRLKQPFCIFMIKKEMQQQEDQARNSGFVTTTMKRKERQPNFHNVVNNYNDDNSSILALFLQTIIPTVDRNLRSLFPGLTLALCYNAKDALQKLQNYGFQSYGLPSSLGGSWLYDTFICWIQQQGQYQKQQREEEMSVMREIGLDEDEENNYCEKEHQQRDSSFADSTSQQLQHQVDSLTQQHQQNIIEIDILYDNFFQYNLSDIHLTANHFATFYEIRQKLFGNRASLPFDQTGFGALNEEDIATLSTGFIMILPNDRNGNFVLSLEPCKAVKCSSESQRRCYFYLLFILSSEQKLDGTQGIVFLVFVNNMDDVAYQLCTTSFVDIQNAFPLNIAYVHLFFEPIGLGWIAHQANAEGLIKKLLDPPPTVLANHNIAEIKNEVFSVPHGFYLEELPVRLGGQWSFCESFKAWQSDRLRIERNYNNNMTIKQLRAFDDTIQHPHNQHQRQSPLPSNTNINRAAASSNNVSCDSSNSERYPVTAKDIHDNVNHQYTNTMIPKQGEHNDLDMKTNIDSQPMWQQTSTTVQVSQHLLAEREVNVDKEIPTDSFSLASKGSQQSDLLLAYNDFNCLTSTTDDHLDDEFSIHTRLFDDDIEDHNYDNNGSLIAPT